MIIVTQPGVGDFVWKSRLRDTGPALGGRVRVEFEGAKRLGRGSCVDLSVYHNRFFQISLYYHFHIRMQKSLSTENSSQNRLSPTHVPFLYVFNTRSTFILIKDIPPPKRRHLELPIIFLFLFLTTISNPN